MYPSLFFSILFALPTTSLFIILPLYLYPGDAGSAWADIYAAINAHPDVEWLIVINPDSGPGTQLYPSDPNIIAGIAKIEGYPNVRTVGYVDTAHGQRDVSAVDAEVDVYAKWATYSDANITIGGIYFDDVSSEATESTYSYYQTLAAHTRSSMPSSATRVVFNPGYRAPTQLFSYCDTMIEFEDSFANYQSQDILQQIPNEFRNQSALQIYSTPEDVDLTGLTGSMTQAGVEAVYFGSDCCYKVFSATLLQPMAEAVAI